MAKMKIPKAKQILGIKKALRNRKTPKQFIPALRKRLRALGGSLVFLFAFLLGFLIAPVANAQQPVSIVPTQQTLAPSGTPCTGSAQIFPINNRNQTQHYAYVVTNSTVTNLVMQIQGLDASGNLYIISDTSTVAQPITGNNSSLQGSGYFPTVQISIKCLPATTGMFTLSYSGGQAITNVNVGSYLISQQDKTIGSTAPAGTTYSTGIFQSPFGNSYGVLYFEYTGAGPAGSTLNITCQTQNGIGSGFAFNLASTTSVQQTFPVPAQSCANVTIQYTAGGASAATYLLDYVFVPPGAAISNGYAHIAGTAATAVKAGPGVLHTVVIGTPAAGTVTLFDLAPASCTGTPASNVVSVITATATFPAAPEIYDTQFNNGICVKASATMDITVNYQ
jgi:hypothetical protein